MSTSNPPNTNWTGSPDSKSAIEAPTSTRHSRALLEDIACAIADAQAALFAGRIHALQSCVDRLQQLCAEFETLHGKYHHSADHRRELVAAAQIVRKQNLLLGAVVRRMRRHLGTLRNLLNGPSLTYQPTTVKIPDREG